MKKPHARVEQHLEQLGDAITGWIDVLTDVGEAEANVPFEARAFCRGAQQRLKTAAEAIAAARTWVKDGTGPVPGRNTTNG